MASFKDLVAKGSPIGEVIASDRFFVRVRGLIEVGLNAQVLFENGDRGLVWEIEGQETTVLNLDSESMKVGTVVVLEEEVYGAPVGKELIGRVVSVKGKPLDGKGALPLKDSEPVFKVAAPIMSRKASDEQLVTGVTVADTLFPTVLGQRVAIIGDARTGKSGFLIQAAAVKSKRIYVFVMINKRKDDVQSLLYQLQQNGAMDRSVVVMASVFESLAEAYVAPYVGCAIAEYLRDQGNDVVIVYDDLSNHAKIYREIALLAHASAGRDSYPGDIFYAHSSLLERAGSFVNSNKTITAFPIVVTPDEDITGYLATNVMSITDGQLIFSRESFQKGQRPAINTGLSVTRIGGRARSPKGQELARVVLKKLADYSQALEFSHFEAGQSSTSRIDIELGERILAVFKQTQAESYSLIQQQLLLETVLRAPVDRSVKIEVIKKAVQDMGSKAELSNAQYEQHLKSLLDIKDLMV